MKKTKKLYTQQRLTFSTSSIPVSQNGRLEHKQVDDKQGVGLHGHTHGAGWQECAWQSALFEGANQGSCAIFKAAWC